MARNETYVSAAILIDVDGEMFDRDILKSFQASTLFEDLRTACIEHLVQRVELLDEHDLFLLAQLLDLQLLLAQIICLLQSPRVSQHRLTYHLTPFDLLLHCCMVVLKTVFTESLLHEGLLARLTQER